MIKTVVRMTLLAWFELQQFFRYVRDYWRPHVPEDNYVPKHCDRCGGRSMNLRRRGNLFLCVFCRDFIEVEVEDLSEEKEGE